MRPLQTQQTRTKIVFFVGFLLAAFLGTNNLPAQNKEIDSLKKIIDHPKTNDTLRILALNKLGYVYQGNFPDKALDYYKRAHELGLKKNFLHGEGLALYSIGCLYFERNKSKPALEYWFKSIEVYKKLSASSHPYYRSVGDEGIVNNLTWISRLYCNIGEMGNFEKHLSEIKEILKRNPTEYSRVAWISVEWAGCYFANGNIDKAMKEFQKALNYFERANDKYGQANTLANIGMAHLEQKNYRRSLRFLNQSLDLYTKINSSDGMSWVDNIIGNLFKAQKKYDSADYYYKKGYADASKTNNFQTRLSSLINLGRLHIETKREDQGIRYWQEAFDLAVTYKIPEYIMTSGLELAKYYETKKDLRKSLEYYKTYLTISDSIDNGDDMKAIGELESKYEFDKAQSNQKITFEKQLEDQRMVSYAEKKTQKYIIASVSIGLLLVIVFSVFLYKRVLVIRKQKAQIETQKVIVEVKNKEIMDSINYAKRIQAAVLPSTKLIKKHLPESFILYKPKDVVAGDFYWMEASGNKVLFAACDCTGHGVPGAMVSVICNNGLNRTVREQGITDPGKILDQTREIVVEEFEKSDDAVNDGMDLALVSLEKNGGSSCKMQFAGANNPVWIIRKDKNEIEETKGNKQHIGKYDAANKFSTHSYDLNKGDLVYIFTDGYKDQFGGKSSDGKNKEGKKFKSSRLKELLISIKEKSMPQQQTELENTFNNWKGDLEQIDDVCIIGVRV